MSKERKEASRTNEISNHEKARCKAAHKAPGKKNAKGCRKGANKEKEAQAINRTTWRKRVSSSY